MTCPLKDQNYEGNCESCSFKVDCMLKDILQKLHDLEVAVNDIKIKENRFVVS